MFDNSLPPNFRRIFNPNTGKHDVVNMDTNTCSDPTNPNFINQVASNPPSMAYQAAQQQPTMMAPVQMQPIQQVQQVMQPTGYMPYQVAPTNQVGYVNQNPNYYAGAQGYGTQQFLPPSLSASNYRNNVRQEFDNWSFDFLCTKFNRDQVYSLLNNYANMVFDPLYNSGKQINMYSTSRAWDDLLYSSTMQANMNQSNVNRLPSSNPYENRNPNYDNKGYSVDNSAYNFNNPAKDRVSSVKVQVDNSRDPRENPKAPTRSTTKFDFIKRAFEDTPLTEDEILEVKKYWNEWSMLDDELYRAQVLLQKQVSAQHYDDVAEQRRKNDAAMQEKDLNARVIATEQYKRLSEDDDNALVKIDKVVEYVDAKQNKLIEVNAKTNYVTTKTPEKFENVIWQLTNDYKVNNVIVNLETVEYTHHPYSDKVKDKESFENIFSTMKKEVEKYLESEHTLEDTDALLDTAKNLIYNERRYVGDYVNSLLLNEVNNMTTYLVGSNKNRKVFNVNFDTFEEFNNIIYEPPTKHQVFETFKDNFKDMDDFIQYIKQIYVGALLVIFANPYIDKEIIETKEYNQLKAKLMTTLGSECLDNYFVHMVTRNTIMTDMEIQAELPNINVDSNTVTLYPPFWNIKNLINKKKAELKAKLPITLVVMERKALEHDPVRYSGNSNSTNKLVGLEHDEKRYNPNRKTLEYDSTRYNVGTNLINGLSVTKKNNNNKFKNDKDTRNRSSPS